MKPEDLDQYGPITARLGEVLAKSVILWKTRGIRKRLRKKLPVLEKLVGTIRQSHKTARDQGLRHFERVYNIALFVVVVDQDISALTRYFSIAYRTWERQFAARQLAIVLHEVADDLPSLLGKDFRKSLATFQLWDGAMEELNRISSLFHAYRAKNGETLKEIRHFVGAHRDHDAARQLDIIERIDPLSVYRMAADFYGCINPLVDFLIRVTTVIGQPGNMIKHLIQTPEFQALPGPPPLPYPAQPQ